VPLGGASAGHRAPGGAAAGRGRGRPDGLAGLPERQREVLVLRYYGDLSEAQIAEALGISPGAVKTHAARGLASLRPVLERTP
jgi:DNA-directed RNA polymerase specialized sigma24 family protein